MKVPAILLLAGAVSAGVERGPVEAPKAPTPLHVQVPTPANGAAIAQAQPERDARLPGFAPELADMPRIDGPNGWGDTSERQALAALARSRPATRQRARWGYAKALIARDRFADALGVLDAMLQDDADLALVANYQLARGIALAELDRPREALNALVREELAGNAEACLWRVRMLAASGAHEEALRETRCAQGALAARGRDERAPFLAAIAESALARELPQLALHWLRLAPDGDPAANILRGRAHVALGQYAEARIRLGRGERGGSAAQRYDARLALIELAVAQRRMRPDAALREVDGIRFVWRGDRIEERALHLSHRLAKAAHNARASIAAGATLIRYYDLGPDLPAMMADVQGQLAALLSPDNRMPLDQAAGLYWDYRDLMPAGGEGDALVARLADRLQGQGLYVRAAELLEHQMRHRARDIAQGPLSVRVATLQILAGRPDRALGAIRETERTIFPNEMLWDRARIQAVALHQMGRPDEALAVLQDVPGSGGLQSELLWKRRDWARLVSASAGELPGPGALNEVKQAVVLRYAIALGMLGREAELARLRTRYEAGFAGLATAPVFDILTRDAASVDPESVTRAMSAIPTASPAGRIADLLDIAPAAGPRRG